MSQLLELCMTWEQSESILYRLLGKMLSIIPLGYAKWLEETVKNEVLPEEWENVDEDRLFERLEVKRQWQNLHRS